jgi:hypothetical protein
MGLFRGSPPFSINFIKLGFVMADNESVVNQEREIV